MRSFLLNICSPQQTLKQHEHGELISYILADPSYRSIRRLQYKIGEGEWYRAAVESLLMKRLLLAANRLDDTVSYFKQSITLSHRLVIIYRNLTVKNFFKIPYSGLSILCDAGNTIRECEERRDELAEMIGNLYKSSGDKQLEKCIERFIDLQDDLLDNVNQMPLEEWSRLHEPTWLVKNWLSVLCWPIALTLFSRYGSKLDLNALVDYFQHSVNIAKSYCNEWIIDPLKNILSIVQYPHDRPLMIMSESALNADRRTLLQMVKSFAADNDISIPDDNTIRSGDLSAILSHYENDIKRPISSALTGSLLRLLFIQLQKGKIDVETALLAMDKLLRANELNFALLTIIPAGYLLFAAIRYSITVISGKSGFARQETIRGQLEKIERLCNLSEGSEKDCGLLLMLVFRLCQTTAVFPDEDLQELISPQLTNEQRRWTAFRLRSYHGLF